MIPEPTRCPSFRPCRKGRGSAILEGLMAGNAPKTATILVGRLSNRDIKMRELMIYVDHELIGNIRFGQSAKIPLTPGSHILKASNGVRSQSMTIEVGGGQEQAFIVGNAPSGCFIAVLAVAGAGPPTVFLEKATPEQAAHWKPTPLKK